MVRELHPTIRILDGELTLFRRANLRLLCQHPEVYTGGLISLHPRRLESLYVSLWDTRTLLAS